MPKEPSDKLDTQITLNPKLEKRTRRVFPTEYNLKLIQQADASKHGELSHLLRRE